MMSAVDVSERFTDRSACREHLQTLDFLRGVAAFVVVLFHFTTRLDLLDLFHHGYLAVDFFFALSGYVVDRAYHAKLSSGQLSVRSFFSARVLRLFPMIAFGIVLAAAVDMFRPGDFSPSQHTFDILVTAVLGFLLLPTLWKTTLEDTTFPLNGPVWSLFFELLANLVHALCVGARKVNVMLLVLMPCSLALLVWSTRNAHSIEVGTHRGNFLLGFPRVFWSYSLGVLLARLDLRAFPAVSRWAYAAVLVSILACPGLPGRLNWMFDIVVIVIAVPLIIAGAANCSEGTAPSPLSRWCADASYPLYMIHYPIVRVMAALGRSLALSPAANLSLAIFVTGLIAVAAMFIFQSYDRPVRRWLGRRSQPSLLLPKT